MPDTVLAVLIALLFSLFLVAVVLGQESKSPPLAWLGLPTFLYLALIGTGNGVSTLLASTVMPDVQLDPAWWKAFLWAFFGVFAFEAVFKNAKIFNQDALDIRKWIETARDNAVGAANQRQARLENEHLERCARELSGLPRQELETQLAQHQVPELLPARDARMDVQLFKAYKLAAARPDHGAAILKARSPKTPRWRIVACTLFVAALGVLAYLLYVSGPQVSPPEATEPPAPVAAESAGSDLASRTVSGSFEEQEAWRVIQELARQLEARAVVDRTIVTKISLELDGNVFSAVMNDVCTIGSCTWHVEPGDPPTVVVDPR